MEMIFHPQVKDDIKELDGSVKKRLKKVLKKIKRAPELGKPLGSRGDIDLSSCLKVYFYRNKYRVVYEILAKEQIIIWSIGKREAEVVYINAYKRILEEEGE
ncbi:type II toxin-antitoxin system RelE/ParE family toxin [Fuchsiella alkaliacetigena]|uniref:type II toxin-antitoxin system RelE/ParE family toxin n=1 Tax=Fuchsiella alkaliacetigena TaxID=957042 RepID=UPI00200A7AB4|nr:type II toxin-antitoxin system RelE/ParE family toxin [Fuchsiella alkaliacetigena]MCK8824865.1 type II toxin-antitoxin system RelE/ParE family toxin [Fuchsiella alkaliacetigena]